MKVSSQNLANYWSMMLTQVLAGKGVCKWVNDKTPGTTNPLVLTDATLYYNLVAGELVVISCLLYGVLSASDSCHFEFGYTSAVAGGGDFTAVTPHFEATTGTVMSERTLQDMSPGTPLVIRYADGARSISVRVTANDNTCVVGCGFQGYRMFDPG